MSVGWRYFLRRLAISVVLLWLLTVLAFVIYLAIPQEPASFLVDVQHATPAQIAKARHELGVDRPVLTQYLDFLRGAVHGDFGIGYQGSAVVNGHRVGPHVGAEVIRAAAVTGWLALGGLALVALISVPAAMLAASRVGSWLDKTILAVTLVGISTHPMVIGVVLQTLAGNRWHLAPPGGYCALVGRSFDLSGRFSFNPPTCGGPRDWASHLALPWVTFALFFVALYMRVIRVQLLDVLRSDYTRTARAKGSSEARVLLRHALPNTVVPVVTMLGMDLGTAIGVAVYVETVYQLPGIGNTLIAALSGDVGFDRPVIMAVVVLVGAAIILFNLVADVLVALADPTVERRGRRRARATAGVV